MHKRLRASEKASGLFAVLLLVALSIRLLVPAGYMPSRAADGVVISLCGSQGAVPAVISLSGAGDVRIAPTGDPDDHSGQPVDSAPLCVFAALAAPALHGAEAMTAAMMPLLPSDVALPPLTQVLLAFPAFLRPPLRGPPPAP